MINSVTKGSNENGAKTAKGEEKLSERTSHKDKKKKKSSMKEWG